MPRKHANQTGKKHSKESKSSVTAKLDFGAQDSEQAQMIAKGLQTAKLSTKEVDAFNALLKGQTYKNGSCVFDIIGATRAYISLKIPADTDPDDVYKILLKHSKDCRVIQKKIVREGDIYKFYCTDLWKDQDEMINIIQGHCAKQAQAAAAPVVSKQPKSKQQSLKHTTSAMSKILAAGKKADKLPKLRALTTPIVTTTQTPVVANETGFTYANVQGRTLWASVTDLDFANAAFNSKAFLHDLSLKL